MGTTTDLSPPRERVPCTQGDDSLTLELNGLIWGYARPVAGSLDLCVHRGERVGVYGPNGAGKSTLLKAIQKCARIHAGTLTVHAWPITGQPQAPQHPAQMPWTGRELLDVFGASLSGLPDALQPTLDRRVDRLSGGQLRLLGVVGALTGPGALVLLDEPTSYLDPETTEAVMASMLRMDERKAVLVVSHDHDFLEQTCTSLVRIAGLT